MVSGDEAVVEVTPNEYKAMTSRSYQSSYRLCIVTNALKRQHTKLLIFAYDDQAEDWFGENQERIKIKEIVAARISAIQ